MKDNTELMDKAIKEKFDGHEVPVPSHLWNSIESNLTPETDNTGGNFFFNNPFILSIFLISTVLIGAYVYNSTSNKTDDSISVLNKKTSTDTKSNNTSTLLSINATNDARSIEKKQGYSIDTEDRNQTSASSLTTNSEAAPNKINSKNKEKNNATNYSTIHQIGAIKNTNATKTKYTSLSQNNNHSKSSKNNLQDANARNSIRIANQSNQTELSNTSSDNVFANETEKTNTHSSYAASTRKSNTSGLINNTTPISNESSNTSAPSKTNTQTLNTTESKNNENVASQTDSTNLVTSASIQEMNLNKKAESSDSNTSTNKNKSSDVSNIKNKETTTASILDTHLNAALVNEKIVPSNTNNTIYTPTVETDLNNPYTGNVELTEAASANKQFVSNTNNSQRYSTNNTLDSINNNTQLENLSIEKSRISNDSVFIANNSTKELLFKMDSTKSKDLDSISVEKLPETIEVISSKEEAKKKSLFLSRCSFDGYVTPALGYLHLSANNNQENIKTFTQNRNQNTSTGFNITSGLRMNYALTQKIEIGIGFQYSSLSQPSSFSQQHIDSMYTYQGFNQIDSTYDSTSHQMIYSSHYIKTDSTSIQTLSTQVKKYTDKFQNFSIPIHIAYGYSISNKLSLLVRTSLLINYQTYSVTYLNASDSSIIGYHSNKNISLGGSFSIGCYYQFSKRCSVFAEPIITYYFSNLFDKQVPFKQTQLMLGLQTGIRLSF